MDKQAEQRESNARRTSRRTSDHDQPRGSDPDPSRPTSDERWTRRRTSNGPVMDQRQTSDERWTRRRTRRREETGGDGRGDRPATTNRYRTVTASDGQAGRPTMCQQRTSSDGRADRQADRKATDEQRRASDGQADGATGRRVTMDDQMDEGQTSGRQPTDQ